MRVAELEKLAGQMIFCGIAGEDTDPQIREMVESGRVGGLVLMGRNSKNSDRVQNMVERLQARSPHGLFVGIDQEGGRVMRLREDRFLLPSAREMAAWPEKELFEQPYLVAQRMNEIGINVNFAPVIDVDSNPANPVIGDRSFGNNADEVWRCAAIYADAVRRGRVLPCFKHFPGHGDTDRDSHLELPFVRHDAQRLSAVELAPFAAAVAWGAEMIMTAHVVFETLDPEYPATLSEKIISGLLRERMGYKGIVISDDLEMKAVAERYDSDEIAFRLLSAGVDMALCCNSYETALNLHRALVRQIEKGRVPLEYMERSVARIRKVKEKWRIGVH